jgi:hypothetical protein
MAFHVCGGLKVEQEIPRISCPELAASFMRLSSKKPQSGSGNDRVDFGSAEGFPKRAG